MSKRAPRIKKIVVDNSIKQKSLKKDKAKDKDTSREKNKKIETRIRTVEKLKPIALVNKSGSITKSLRKGRGFSIPEINRINIKLSQARKLGLNVDLRRNTEFTHNIDVLKKFTKNNKKIVANNIEQKNKKNKEKKS